MKPVSGATCKSSAECIEDSGMNAVGMIEIILAASTLNGGRFRTIREDAEISFYVTGKF